MTVGVAKQIANTSARVSAGGRRMRETSYRVITDDVADGSGAVQGAVGLPRIGDVYADIDTGCVCVDLIIDRISRYVWHVTALYSTEYESIAQILNEPPEVDFPSEPGEEPLVGEPNSNLKILPPDSTAPSDPNTTGLPVTFRPTGGKGIINSAGDIYDPPATNRTSTPLVRITRNESSSSFSMLRKVLYENSVNSSAWNGLNSRMAWLRLYTGQAMYFTPPTITLTRQLYWRVTYEFALKYETWDLFLPDAGPSYIEYTGSSGRKKPFIGPNGPYIGFLDHKTDPAKPGQKLAAGADIQYKQWRRKREQNFADLNIDLTIALKDMIATPRGFRPFPDPSKTPIEVK